MLTWYTYWQRIIITLQIVLSLAILYANLFSHLFSHNENHLLHQILSMLTWHLLATHYNHKTELRLSFP